jgi:hypothetical protein
MGNTLTEVAPKLLAQGLMALRQNSIMPRLVNRSYDAMAAMKGQTINIPIPSAITVQDVAPAATPPATADISPTSVAIPLDQWKEAPFELTDKDQNEIMDGTIPMMASEAIKGLCNTVDAYILGLYTDFYGYTGTAGTTPFSAAPANLDFSDATNVRTILNRQLAPMSDRRLVLDPTAEGKALNQRALQDQSWRGQGGVMNAGQIGSAIGMDWYMDQNVVTHTAGTITTGLISKASTSYAVGIKTILATTAASTGACALKVGDIITFAGDSQTYVLTAAATQAVAASDVTLSFEPGLKVAHTGSEAVTVKASHVVNLCFHRDAIAFCTRPLDASNAAELGSIVQSAVDPISGLTLRLEINREFKRNRWSFDILYGGKVIRRELGARLAG